MKIILRRALSDTLSGYVKAAALGLIGFCVTFFILWQQRGWDAAMDELGIWAASVAGAIGAVFLLFLWNLACAPYRVEKQAHELTKSALLKIENRETADDQSIPWCLRDIITEDQCDALVSSHDFIQVTFSHRLRAPPTITSELIGKRIYVNNIGASGVSLSVPEGISASHDLARTFNKYKTVFDARTEEQVELATRRLGFNDNRLKADEFILAALRDPEKGYAYLKRSLS